LRLGIARTRAHAVGLHHASYHHYSTRTPENAGESESRGEKKKKKKKRKGENTATGRRTRASCSTDTILADSERGEEKGKKKRKVRRCDSVLESPNISFLKRAFGRDAKKKGKEAKKKRKGRLDRIGMSGRLSRSRRYFNAEENRRKEGKKGCSREKVPRFRHFAVTCETRGRGFAAGQRRRGKRKKRMIRGG